MIACKIVSAARFGEIVVRARREPLSRQTVAMIDAARGSFYASVINTGDYGTYIRIAARVTTKVWGMRTSRLVVGSLDHQTKMRVYINTARGMRVVRPDQIILIGVE